MLFDSKEKSKHRNSYKTYEVGFNQYHKNSSCKGVKVNHISSLDRSIKHKNLSKLYSLVVPMELQNVLVS